MGLKIIKTGFDDLLSICYIRPTDLLYFRLYFMCKSVFGLVCIFSFIYFENTYEDSYIC